MWNMKHKVIKSPDALTLSEASTLYEVTPDAEQTAQFWKEHGDIFL